MRICKIWDAEYPWDIRVEKVARALTGAGHEVHLVARNRDDRALVESLPEATVHRLRPLPRLGRRLSNASMFPAFFNPRWLEAIQRTARDTRAELILCRDLPLAPTALRVARRLRLPVVVDLAEDYPGLLSQLYNLRDFRPHNLLVRNPWFAAILERSVVQRADGILVVAEEAAARIQTLGAPASRIALVGNTPTRERIEAIHPQLDRDPPAQGPLRLVYLGLLETARGVELMLRGMRALKDAGDNVSLDLFGMDAGDQWQTLARNLGLTSVRFHGYVPHDHALARLPGFDVGLMPHHVSRHIRTTLPNKLFDYMAAGLPILATDAAPVRRILEEEACGIVFPDRDVPAFVAGVRRLRDPVLRRDMARRGRLAVETRYHWDRDRDRLLGFLAAVRGGVSQMDQT